MCPGWARYVSRVGMVTYVVSMPVTSFVMYFLFLSGLRNVPYKHACSHVHARTYMYTWSLVEHVCFQGIPEMSTICISNCTGLGMRDT